jgi:hypothetical protein
MPIEEEFRLVHSRNCWRALAVTAACWAAFVSPMLTIFIQPKAKPPPRAEEPQIEIFRYMPNIRVLPASPTPDPSWTHS